VKAYLDWRERYEKPIDPPRTIQGYRPLAGARIKPGIGKLRLSQLDAPTLDRFYMDPELYLFLRLEATTGLRSRELCALCWQDFDLDAGELIVGHNVVHARAAWRVLAQEHQSASLRRRPRLPLAGGSASKAAGRRPWRNRSLRNGKPGHDLLLVVAGVAAVVIRADESRNAH
jgi:integrase